MNCAKCGGCFPILKALYWPLGGPYCCESCIQKDRKAWTDKQWEEYEEGLKIFRDVLLDYTWDLYEKYDSK